MKYEIVVTIESDSLAAAREMRNEIDRASHDSIRRLDEKHGIPGAVRVRRVELIE